MPHDLPSLAPGKILGSGKWLTLSTIKVAHPNGHTSEYEVVRRNKERVQRIVSILPLSAEGEVILIRQFRFPLEYAHLESPAGCQEPGKHLTLDDVVRDELMEETGYKPGKIHYIGRFSSSSGMTDEVVDGHIATNCQKVTTILQLDQSEYIEPVVIPYSQFDQLILDEFASGRAVDPKLLAMMYYFRTFLLKNDKSLLSA